MSDIPTDADPNSWAFGGDLEALVDAHVHFHDRFDEGRFFDAAWESFARAARALGVRRRWEGFLIFTESAGADRFASLYERLGDTVGSRWRIEATGEDTSVRLHDEESRAALVVVAGRQIQTSEGLEVLAFPMRVAIPDGAPIRNVLDGVAETGALSQVPWGFGKWSFSRGRLVHAVFDETAHLAVLFSDTGHRPGWAPRPALLERAEALDRPTLTGSDPLPLAGEESRPGSCCFWVTLPPSSAGPAERLRHALSALEISPGRFERRPGLLDFLTKQVAMQIRKRYRR